MDKFSLTEKIQAVKWYWDGTESGKTIAKSMGVTPILLCEWIRRYESSGENAFEKRYSSYSTQYKLDVLNYMNEHGTSIRETAALFNILSYETLWKWKIAYKKGGLDALHSKKRGVQPWKIKNKTSSRRINRSTTSGKWSFTYGKCILKKVECLSSKQETVTKQDKAQVIYELRHEFPVKELLQLANIPVVRTITGSNGSIVLIQMWR